MNSKRAMIEYFKGGFKKQLKVTYNISSAFFFALYPYKKQSENINRIFIRKEAVSNHEMALSYEEFLQLRESYIKHRAEYLKTGRTYKFTSGIGYLSLIKYKRRNSKQKAILAVTRKLRRENPNITSEEIGDYIIAQNENGDLPKFESYPLNGYELKLAWYKKPAGLSFLRFWKFRLVCYDHTPNYGLMFYLKYLKNNLHELSNLRETTVKTYE